MAFHEGWVEADGFRIRFMEAGDGPPLVHLHGAGGVHLTLAHELLSQTYRVIVLEMPGSRASSEKHTDPNNTGSGDDDGKGRASDRAESLQPRGHLVWRQGGAMVGHTGAIVGAGVGSGSTGGYTAEGQAACRRHPQIRIARRLYAHPERMPQLPVVDTAQARRGLWHWFGGCAGRTVMKRWSNGFAWSPDADPGRFWHSGAALSPQRWVEYTRNWMSNSHLVFVYDAGHAIVAAERPEAFVDVVTDFLERGDAFLISRAKTVVFP